MDLRKLKTLLELFEQSNLQEMEFCEGEERVRLKKPGADAPAPAPILAVNAAEQPTGGAPAAEPSPSELAGSLPVGTLVKSPMVGTFYRSSAPDKPPFVRVGQRVEAGDTLCIIEAMKLMNEIPSPISGEVKEIIVENGEQVAYGNKLFIIH